MKDIIDKIRKTKPIIHCITNPVTMNDCANILVAVGASPIMAHHIEEVSEITEGAHALVCNLGATDDYDAMKKSIKTANDKGIPVVLDPVGIAASTYRRNFACSLMQNLHIDCVRGNYSEIASLIQNIHTASGLDNKLKVNDIQWKNIKEFSMEHQTMIFMTGTSDYVIDGNAEIAEITDEAEAEQSDTMMTSITGSGCMLSAFAGAFLAIDNSRETLIKVSQMYRECGETATKKARKLCAGSMTFRNMLIDEISNL